jgi:predicted metalloprotease with PDZ domain
MNKKSTVLLVVSSLLLIDSIIIGYSGKEKHNYDVSFNPNSNKKENNNFINFSIEPFYEINKVRFIVTMEFPGDKSGETKILIPNEFAGQKNLEGIKFLKPLSESTSIINTDNIDQKIIKHQPESIVKLYYQVEEIRDDDIELGNNYMVILNKSFFHFLGETFFILPMWDWHSSCRIRISWNHMPFTWTFANSFGVNEKVQTINTSLAQFSGSIFTGGDFRISKKQIGSNPVYLSIRGSWNFSDDQFLELVRNILRVERDFWNDNNFPFYIITVIPIEGRGDQGGIGRTNAYSLFLSKDRIIDYPLKRILAHESFHTWLGSRMKFAEPEVLVYWFKEGFCDYYTRLLLLRANLITLDEYVDEYNKILYAYYTSPVRNEKNERIAMEFWTNQSITKLPYMRGDIIAHNLNAIIYNNSGGVKSLDDFMRDLYNRSIHESLTISNGSLSALIRFYAGEKALSGIMTTVNSGSILKSRADALGPCFIMEIESYRKLWLIGELFEIPAYKLKPEYNSNNKKCLQWFGVD